MSNLHTLVKRITRWASPTERIGHLELIAKALAEKSYPFGQITSKITIPAAGETTAVEVDSTVWMAPGQNIQIGDVSDGIFVGLYARIVEITDGTTILAQNVESINALPGDKIPSGSKVMIGVPRGDRYGSVTCDRGIGWVKLRGLPGAATPNWVPYAPNAAVRCVIDFPEDGQRERTVIFALNKNTGIITASIYNQVENGISVSLSGDGTEAVIITFTDVQTGVQRQHALYAIDGRGVDGATGNTGLTGKNGAATFFAGIWNASENYLGSDYLRHIVAHDRQLFLANFDNQNREPITGKSDYYWTNLDIAFDGLTLMSGGGGGIALSPQGDLLVVGNLTGRISARADSESYIELGAIANEHEAPVSSHQSGDFTEAFKLGIWSRHGGQVIAKAGGDPTYPTDLLNPNLLLHSCAFENANWVKTDTVILADDTEAPDSTSLADRATGTGGIAIVQNVPDNEVLLIAPGQAVTFSVWAKPTAAEQQITLKVMEFSGNIFLDESTTVTVQTVDGWARYRCLHKVKSDLCDKLIVKIGGEWEGALAVYLWGAQLEWGMFPTQHQVTTTARKGLFAVAADNTTIIAKSVKLGSTSYPKKLVFGHEVTVTVGVLSLLPETSMFSDSMEITLKSDTVGASIRYTIDGSDPAIAAGQSSPVTFTIYNTVKIRAVATLAGSVNSTEVSVLKTKATEKQIKEGWTIPEGALRPDSKLFYNPTSFFKKLF